VDGMYVLYKQSDTLYSVGDWYIQLVDQPGFHMWALDKLANDGHFNTYEFYHTVEEAYAEAVRLMGKRNKPKKH
jgi:hypothetical protein